MNTRYCKWKQPLEVNPETGKYRFECERCGNIRNHKLKNYNIVCNVPMMHNREVRPIVPIKMVEMKLNGEPAAFKPVDGTDLAAINIPEKQAPEYLPFETPASQRKQPTKPTAIVEPVQPADGPNLLQKAANFTKAITRHVAGGMNLCTEEQIQKRAEICFGCEFFRRNPDGESGVCSHLGCGCNINLRPKMLNKLAMPTEKCPVDKWGPEPVVEPE